MPGEPDDERRSEREGELLEVRRVLEGLEW